LGQAPRNVSLHSKWLSHLGRLYNPDKSHLLLKANEKVFDFPYFPSFPI
jgi:hypothetical protein